MHPGWSKCWNLSSFLGTRLAAFLHQPANSWSLMSGTHLWRPTGDKILNQNSCAKTQDVNMCWMVSFVWSQVEIYERTWPSKIYSTVVDETECDQWAAYMEKHIDV
jgi:hypothetical protein